MKTAILISFIASIGAANAAIYKCDSGSGLIEYQDIPCGNQLQLKKIAIEPIDPKVVKRAQEKLAKELHEREQLEKQRADAEIIERQLRAQELNASANAELVYESRKRTEAIYGYTRALNRNSRTRYWNRYRY